jgi:FAD/FMN-containing dehydrogenase/Fe-S oxidoreductase
VIADDLEQALRKSIRGEVRFDAGSRALYASDASNYRQVPVGLVVPRDADDVAAAVAACRQFGAPVLPRGAGTSLAGQCCNVAVVLDFTKYMNRILEIDPERRFARVEPGVVLDSLRSRAETRRLTFGPDPSTHSRCTLGGMIGNNSCGTHSLLAGKTVDNIEELRVLLYDGTEMTVGATADADLDTIARSGGRRGEIYSRLRALRDRHADAIRAKFPCIPRRVSGYNLDELLPERGFHVARSLVGSEGTCAIVLDAKVTLIRSPQHRALIGLGYADAFEAADHVPEILEFAPIGLEGFEGAMVDGLRLKGSAHLDLLPAGRGILLVEFGADDPKQAADTATRLVEMLRKSANAPVTRIYSAAESKAVWKLRESGPRAAANIPGTPPRWEGWDDAAVAPERLGRYLRELRQLLNDYQYNATFYGHFGHGCIHMQVSFELNSEAGVRKYGSFVNAAADLVVRHGGSISGEHGDGKSRSALLPKMFGAELMSAFNGFKSAWDPDNKLNPNNIVNAPQPTEHLRLGGARAAADRLIRASRFKFPDDGGSLASAADRCIGIGECRKQDAGAMCPSYMVTLEEEHSTRGRAHMLAEVLRGDVLRGGWNDEQVKHSLDLCLSCKACKSECPTNVDIATYRAEFLSHYYDRHRRPLHAFAFGMVNRWLSLASVSPMLANAMMQAPGLNAVVKKTLDMAPQRRIPRLARTSFRRWARRRRVSTSGGDVILWVDTFNNAFHPETTRAAYEVLTAAGCRVSIPRQMLCCGRPLYDFGLLDQAAAYLRRVIDALAVPIDSGIPIVVLEPSCASVFRDELRSLFPADPHAERLRTQTFLLSEFLEHRVPAYRPPELAGKVLLHGHCHHKAVMKLGDEESLLRKAGADVETLDAGCCGMAGSFGFDAEKYAVSQAIGERVLLPAVRSADAGTLIVSDGFSCREQIGQSTSREALHLADVLRLASARQTR